MFAAIAHSALIADNSSFLMATYAGKRALHHHRFLHEPLVCSGRSTTCSGPTAHVHHPDEEGCIKAAIDRWWSNETVLPMRLTRLRLVSSRSLTGRCLGRVQSQRIDRQNRLRPLTSLPASKPTC